MNDISKPCPWQEIRKWLCSFILALVLFLQADIVSYAAQFTVTDTSAVMYTSIPTGCYFEPDAAAAQAGVVPVGTPVQVTGITSNGWVRIQAGAVLYIPGNALTQNAQAIPAQPVPQQSVPQYADTVSYTISSREAAVAASADARSKHASTVNLSNKGVSYETIKETFFSVTSSQAAQALDYATANIRHLKLRYSKSKSTVTYQYLSTIDEEIYTDAAVAQLVPQFNKGTTYDKILAVHDYICNTVSYSYETLNKTADFASAYDALYYKTTVCSGYALLFQKFMDYLGIPCYVATGNVNGPHAWNLVNIDGLWYHIDCTNDDQSWGISRYRFLKGASLMGSPTWGGIPISPNDYRY